jgi:hypothetical protein
LVVAAQALCLTSTQSVRRSVVSKDMPRSLVHQQAVLPSENIRLEVGRRPIELQRFDLQPRVPPFFALQQPVRPPT